MFSTTTKVLGRKLNEFLFARDDTEWDVVRVIAAIGVLGPLLLAGISGNYERLYGHWGILPRAYALDRVYWPAFLFIMKSDPAWIWWIFWATVAASLCLALGLWTRIAAAATFFLYVATIQRNLLSFNGECGILGFALLALAMAPTPQPFSLDHLLLKKPLPEKAEQWPARFLQINVCMMYFFTTMGKIVGEWDIGTGEVWYQITLCDWFRFPNAEWLRARWMCWLVVHSSLLLEGSFAFLVWTRLRLPLVVALIAMHVIIATLFLNSLLFFNLAAIGVLVGFIRKSDRQLLRGLLRRKPRRGPIPAGT